MKRCKNCGKVYEGMKCPYCGGKERTTWGSDKLTEDLFPERNSQKARRDTNWYAAWAFFLCVFSLIFIVRYPLITIFVAFSAIALSFVGLWKAIFKKLIRWLVPINIALAGLIAVAAMIVIRDFYTIYPETIQPVTVSAPVAPESMVLSASTTMQAKVAENDKCLFSIDSVQETDEGVVLAVTCINHDNRPYVFSWRNAALGGYMMNPFWAVTVEGGRTAQEQILFERSRLEESHLSSVTEIMFRLYIYDPNNSGSKPVVDQVFTYYPGGKEEASAVYAERITVPGEDIVLDDENACFVILQPVDSFWGYTLECYMENRKDKTLLISWSDVYINGQEADPMWAVEVFPRKRGYSKVSFFGLDEGTEVHSIEFRLNIAEASDPSKVLSERIMTWVPERAG